MFADLFYLFQNVFLYIQAFPSNITLKGTGEYHVAYRKEILLRSLIFFVEYSRITLFLRHQYWNFKDTR